MKLTAVPCLATGAAISDAASYLNAHKVALAPRMLCGCHENPLHVKEIYFLRLFKQNMVAGKVKSREDVKAFSTVFSHLNYW